MRRIQMKILNDIRNESSINTLFEKEPYILEFDLEGENMIYFKSDSIKHLVENQINTPTTISKLKTIADENDLSLAYFSVNENGIYFLMNQDIAEIDNFGELIYANGRFVQFLDLNSSVTDFEDNLKQTIDHIMNDQFDILCLGNLEFQKLQ